MILLLRRLLIAGNALVYLGFGPAFWFLTERLTADLGIHLSSATAFADFRAMYGGLSFGVGTFFAASLIREKWQPACLFLIACTSTMLLVSRIGSLVATAADVGGYIYLAMFLELSSAVLSAWLWRKSAEEKREA